MIELNISKDEFIKLMSGQNNKTCPESEYCYANVADCFLNGIGFLNNGYFEYISSIKEKLSKDSLNDPIYNLLSEYQPVIILKIFPRPNSSRDLIECLPLDTYFEYIGERYANENSQELEAREKSIKLVRKILTKSDRN